MSTTNKPTEVEQRLDGIEDAIASVYAGLCCFKPLPLGRPEHAALAELIQRAAIRNGGQETRPFTMPEHRQIGGVVG